MTTCHDIYVFDDKSTAGRRIVVGVDSSHASRSALRWAVEQARVSGARIQAVLVYPPDPYLSFAYGDYPAVTTLPPDHVRQDALDVLRGVVASEVPDVDVVEVDLVLLAGTAPAKLLTQHAADADMLVVGCRHRHGLGVLLGSTAAGCVRHARCPVVVVPDNISVAAGAVASVGTRMPQPV